MEISKRWKIRELEEWKIGKGNEKRQGRDTRQRHSGMTEEQTRHRIATQPTVVRNDDTSVVMPECSCRASRILGFTLVELVIVIAIVIVLSVVSVPIYRSYVNKAIMSEGYALMGTVLSAQKAYYSEYGYFLMGIDSESSDYTSYHQRLGIDIRGNKYFTWFGLFGGNAESAKISFTGRTFRPIDLIGGKSRLDLVYNITTGATYREY